MLRNYQLFLESDENIQLELNPEYTIMKYFVKNLENSKETVLDEMSRNLTEYLSNFGYVIEDINFEEDRKNYYKGYVVFKYKDIHFLILFQNAIEISIFDITGFIQDLTLKEIVDIYYESSYVIGGDANTRGKTVIGPHIIMKFKDIPKVVNNYLNKREIKL